VDGAKVVVAVWIWFTVAGLLLIAEMLTVDLLFASLALAALAAGITNAAGGSQVVQGVVFAVFAILSLISLRPIALRHLKKQVPGAATNVDALIGARAVATTRVDQGTGQIKLNGEIWSAHADSGVIESGETVVVTAIDGATARVTKAEGK
jgi:membrane protein implicated in regulation of membrane protease activity